MSLSDNHIEKWKDTDHCQIKHLLLTKYLPTWITILGSRQKRICYFDGFAGRGEYSNGRLGSPIIALRALEEVKNKTKVRNFEYNCMFIEKNPDNYNNLKVVIEREKPNYPSVNHICCKNTDFDTAINEILDNLENRNKLLAPSFFFIDPFGFTGVNFSTIQRILSQPRTEIFFNFMVRDVNRFLNHPHQAENMNRLFGNDSWRTLCNMQGAERQNALRDLYIENLIDSGVAKYVWPFKVCQDDKNATLYYLIYATNNFKGLDVMKGIMFNQNEYFAYLGPKEHAYQALRNQPRLFDFEEEHLKLFLLNKYKNTSRTYEEIKEETYMHTQSIDKHYRAAIKSLEKEGKVRIDRISSKEYGVKGKDRIYF